MSRAAALASRKAEQKSNIAASRADHEARLAIGLNSTMEKAIKGDVILCINCGATQKGPLMTCTCTGGKQKPQDPTSLESLQILMDAARARHAVEQEAKKHAALKSQGAVAGARAKKRDAAKQGDDPELEVQGDGGTEYLVVVTFPVGKLGFDLEKNCVKGVSTAEQVQRGWVVADVNDVQVSEKKQIQKEVTKLFKASQPANIRFRVPIAEKGYAHCSACDKFQEEKEFDGEQLDCGPGLQKCVVCEEFGDFE